MLEAAAAIVRYSRIGVSAPQALSEGRESERKIAVIVNAVCWTACAIEPGVTNKL